MKYLFLAIALLSINATFAQECFTTVDISHETNLIKFNKSNWTSGNENFNVRVQAHIITSTSGVDNFNEALIEEAIDNLNLAFGPVDNESPIYGNGTLIQFTLDPCIDYIHQDTYDSEIEINERADALDIYFYPYEAEAGWGGRGS